jgi:hypothetical protein
VSPKFYWRQVKRTDDIQYEVIDGQQRLRAIWEFAANDFPLAKDADPINGFDIRGKTFRDLPLEVTEMFDTYSIDVVVVMDATDDDEEVRDMFLRLQNGTTLKAQEKRNAMGGAMRDFVKQIAAHLFFNNCAFSNTRFTHDHVAAQTILIEMKGGPTSVKDADLNRLYTQNQSFDPNSAIAKKVRRTYDFLLTAFPNKTPELERYNVINLYCIASTLVGGYAYKELSKSLADWFIGFEAARRADEQKPEDQRDPTLTEYRRLTSYSTDAEENIRSRLKTLEQSFFQAAPDLEPIDPIRAFSAEQRLAIFRRDGGLCQLRIKCNGEAVSWDNWHADHKIPHSKGGKTTVANGQLACAACNQAKGAYST